MILERIRQQYPQLTRSQRRLADFLVGSYQSAAFMTAARFAEAVGVNEATVIRFAQRLGYSGFPAMIEEVQQIVHQDLMPGGRLMDEDTQDQCFHLALAGEAELLQRTMRQVPPDVVSATLDAILAAEHIVVVGQGRTSALAAYLGAMLGTLGLPAQSAELASLDLAGLLTDASETTTVIGVSLDENDERIARALTLAADHHARTVAITDSTISPAARAAELALTFSSAGGLATPSAAALVAVMDALVHCAARRDPERCEQRKEETVRAREYLLSGRGSYDGAGRDSGDRRDNPREAV